MRQPNDANATLALLSPLIGLRGNYAGRSLELVDVLADGPQAVLLESGAEPGIRVDQYGIPKHREPPIFSIPVFSELEPDAHPVLLALLPLETLEALRSLIPTNRR